MAAERELHYFHQPRGAAPVPAGVEFLPVADFLADEPACKLVWELVDTQFRTRGKFLAVWRCASFVAAHRDADGALDGFLLVSAPVNWQIDYVVVRPDARGQGIASRLVAAALAHAARRAVPYVMLTSKESLRPLYEGCGFTAVSAPAAQLAAT